MVEAYCVVDYARQSDDGHHGNCYKRNARWRGAPGSLNVRYLRWDVRRLWGDDHHAKGYRLRKEIWQVHAPGISFDLKWPGCGQCHHTGEP